MLLFVPSINVAVRSAVATVALKRLIPNGRRTRFIACRGDCRDEPAPGRKQERVVCCCVARQASTASYGALSGRWPVCQLSVAAAMVFVGRQGISADGIHASREAVVARPH